MKRQRLLLVCFVCGLTFGLGVVYFFAVRHLRAQASVPRKPFTVMLYERAEGGGDLPAFFGPPITGEQRQSAWLSRSRVLLGQREPASPASAHRHPSQHGAAL